MAPTPIPSKEPGAKSGQEGGKGGGGGVVKAPSGGISLTAFEGGNKVVRGPFCDRPSVRPNWLVYAIVRPSVHPRAAVYFCPYATVLSRPRSVVSTKIVRLSS